ncbi:MAG: hypothetical protein DMG16_25670, partial [Acidobacteria bacterium]
ILWRFAVQALVNVLLFDWAADFALTVLEPNGAVPAATSRRLILIAMLSALWVGATGLILGTLGLLRFEIWYGFAFLWFGLARWRKSPAVSLGGHKISRWMSLGSIGVVILIGLSFYMALRYGSKAADDISGYHLPFAIEWLQTGSIGPVNRPLNDFMNYPPIGFLLDAWLISPTLSDTAVGLLGIPFWPILILVVYALAVDLGQDPGIARPLAAVGLCVPFAVRQAATPYTDIVAAAAWGVGLLYMFRWAKQGRWSDVAISALMSGFAWGAKPWGFIYVGLLIPIALVTGVRRVCLFRTRSHALAGGIVWLVIVFLLGGAWHVRTWVKFGNPFYPVEFALGPHVLFPGPLKNPGFELASDPWFLLRFYNQLLYELGPWLTVICPVALLFFIIRSMRHRWAMPDRTGQWIIAVLALACIAVLFYMPNMRANFPWDFRRVIPLWILLLVCGACLPLSGSLVEASWLVVLLGAAEATSRITGYWLTGLIVVVPTLYATGAWFSQHPVRISRWVVGVTGTVLLTVIFGINHIAREQWRFTEGLGYDDWPVQEWVYKNVKNSRIQAVGEWRTHLLYGQSFTNHVIMPVPIGKPLYHSDSEWLQLLASENINYIYVDNWRRFNKNLAGGALYLQAPELKPHPEYEWAENHPNVFRTLQVSWGMVPNWLPASQRERRAMQVLFQVDQKELSRLIWKKDNFGNSEPAADRTIVGRSVPSFSGPIR